MVTLPYMGAELRAWQHGRCERYTISLEAQLSESLVELRPLSPETRERYLLEVLRAKHGYTGELSGVPAELRQVRSRPISPCRL